MFPSSDDRWKDANSMELLRRVVFLLRSRNFEVVNVDVTVICEEPRIGPVAPAMREKLGRILEVGATGVSVKGKTDDGLGWTGGGEGMAVHAVALIQSLGDSPQEGSQRQSSFL